MNRYFINILFLSVLLFSLVGIIFLQQQKINALLSQSIASLAPTPTASPATTSTEAWQTYHNENFKINFNYPTDWTVQPEQIFGSRSITEFRYQNTPLFTISFIGNYSQITGKPYQSLEEYLGKTTTIPQKITLDGRTALQVSDSGQPGMVFPYNKVVFFSTDKKDIIELYYEPEYYPQNNQVLNQILSTFKFTQ